MSRRSMVMIFVVAALVGCDSELRVARRGDAMGDPVGDVASGDGPGGCVGGDPASTVGDSLLPGDALVGGGDRLGDRASDGGLVGDSGDGEPSGDPAGDPPAGDPDACPADMVAVDGLCVDRYEASRSDATPFDPGADDTIAVSQPGVLPWYVTSMSSADLDLFAGACAAAGKRLCDPVEWRSACDGPQDTTYVFGSEFDPETCNSVEALCYDYCVAHSIDPLTCNVGANCGYDCGVAGSGVTCFAVLPTGSFADCTNAYGTFDINGNVWEVVPSTTDVRGFEIRGGACNCAAPAARLTCSYNATWNALFAGFRCCRPR